MGCIRGSPSSENADMGDGLRLFATRTEHVETALGVTVLSPFTKPYIILIGAFEGPLICQEASEKVQFGADVTVVSG